MKCTNCRNEQFEAQDGLYFCTECGIQQDNAFVMEADEAYNPNLRKVYVADDTIKKAKRAKYLKGKKLTTWEEYNLILLGLVNEISQINNIPNFKETVLQLWITYLKKTEAAFLNNEAYAPKLQANFRDADAEILYNKKPPPKAKKKRARKTAKPETEKQKRKAMRKSEKAISQQLSESLKSESQNSSSVFTNLSLDAIIAYQEDEEIDIEFSRTAKKLKEKHNVTDERKLYMRNLKPIEKMSYLNSRTLFFIITCALNICKSDIMLSDLIRFTREGHMSLHSVMKFLPEEYLELGVSISHNDKTHNYKMIDDNQIRLQLSLFVDFIPDLAESLEMPNLMTLIRRHISEFNLPEDIERYCENLLEVNPPRMRYRLGFPNYEGRAMAFILFILKLLFGIDDYREYNMSQATANVQEKIPGDLKIFNFMKWKEFIEYRKLILEKFYYLSVCHKDFNGTDSYKVYNVMNETLNPDKPKCVRTEGPKNVDKYAQSKLNLGDTIDSIIDVHKKKLKGVACNYKKYSFEPSLTPLRDYFKQIVENEEDVEINKDIANTNFSENSCEIYLRPKRLVEILEGAGVPVEIEKSSFPKNFKVILNKKQTNRRRKGRTNQYFYELQISDTSHRKWKKSFVEDHANILAGHLKVDDDTDQMRHNKVLQRRHFWRDKIAQHETTLDQGECMFEKESESEQSDNGDDDFILKNDTENDTNVKTLKFLTPDYNMWRFGVKTCENADLNDDELDGLPENFLWLLNAAANIVHQQPHRLYNELITIEYQYMVQLQPMELVENVLKRQDDLKLTMIDVQHKSKYPEMW